MDMDLQEAIDYSEHHLFKKSLWPYCAAFTRW